jgi:hypothetical protein
LAKSKRPVPFGPGKSGRPAIVGWMPVDYGYYSLCYRFVGEGMIEKAHAEQLEDFYVYPIGYIYRHALELALKHANYAMEDALAARARLGMVPKAERLTHKQVDEAMGNLPFHKLTPLLDRLEKRLALIDRADPFDPDVKAVVLAVEQFDPDGQRFRFPELSKGRGPSFKLSKKGQAFIDLENIRDAIEPALAYLIDGLDGWLEADKEASEAMGEDVGYENDWGEP